MRDEHCYSKFETMIFEAVFLLKEVYSSIKFNYLYLRVDLRITHTGVGSYIV